MTLFSAGTSLSLASTSPLLGLGTECVGVYQIMGFAVVVHNVRGFYGEREGEVKLKLVRIDERREGAYS